MIGESSQAHFRLCPFFKADCLGDRGAFGHQTCWWKALSNLAPHLGAQNPKSQPQKSLQFRGPGQRPCRCKKVPDPPPNTPKFPKTVVLTGIIHHYLFGRNNPRGGLGSIPLLRLGAAAPALAQQSLEENATSANLKIRCLDQTRNGCFQK